MKTCLRIVSQYAGHGSPCVRDTDAYERLPDCRGFRRCVNGIWAYDACAPGLFWDNGRNVCDYEANVVCGKRTMIYLEY